MSWLNEDYFFRQYSNEWVEGVNPTGDDVTGAKTVLPDLNEDFVFDGETYYPRHQYVEPDNPDSFVDHNEPLNQENEEQCYEEYVCDEFLFQTNQVSHFSFSALS